MVQRLQLISLQIKTQTSAILDAYTTVSETLPSMIQSIQTINDIMKEMNINIADDEERQQKERIL
jgi:hypothetical protein